MAGMDPRGGDTSPTYQPRQCRTHSVGLPARTSLLQKPPPTGSDIASPIPRRHSAAPTVAPPPIPLRPPEIPKRNKNERPIPIQKPTPRFEPNKRDDKAAESAPISAPISAFPPRANQTSIQWRQPEPADKKLIDLDAFRKNDNYVLAFEKEPQSAKTQSFVADFEKADFGKSDENERQKSNFEELQKASKDLEKRLQEREHPVSKFIDQQRKPTKRPQTHLEKDRSHRDRPCFEDLQGEQQLQRTKYEADMEKARIMLQNSLKKEKSACERLEKLDKLEKLPKATQTNIPPPLSSICQSPVPKPIGTRQDSTVSSDSFSQTSSPSYTSKTMDAPLLPHKHVNGKVPGRALAPDMENPPGSPITKSMSTPASLQTIVRFHNGSNTSLHHKIIGNIRRPSSHYVTRERLRFRFIQVVVNAVALLAIAGGFAAYFKWYPAHLVKFENKTLPDPGVVVISEPVRLEVEQKNPAPGICLPVIVTFCQNHKIPYNFTVFPNYMGNFGQPEAQLELELYNAVVDVRCYELAALFLCTVFVPKCGSKGQVVRPCRSLCYQTKRRCGFFLEVFGLNLPDYLECDLFPENPDADKCVGHLEVVEAARRAEKHVCTSGFQCDGTRCIPVDWRCDGHVDCADKSDELGCGECTSTSGPAIAGKKGKKTGMKNVFAKPLIHCGERRCMSSSHICDGVMDCPWGQDERNCLRLSERNGDVGKGRLEVYHAEKGAFLPACVTRWEATSAQAICSFLGYSVANSSTLYVRGTNVTPMEEKVEIQQWPLAHKPHVNLLKEFQGCTEQKAQQTVELTCSEYECGRRRHNYGNLRAQPRIVGGVESAPGDWPFLAALLGGPEQVFYCAGVLIADQWVLTASHCVGNHSDVSGWTIQLGITRRHAHTYLGRKVKVKRVVPHPNYDQGVPHDNDVALFQLENRVQFHEHLRPVCLPTAETDLTPGTVCTVIGWGKKEDTNASEYAPAVNEVKVPVLNRELCNLCLGHKFNVTDGMMCAGYLEGGKDACQGDSGGPLLCQDETDQERWFVGGIVSWGIKCAYPNLPGVYAYVPKYVPWIHKEIAKYSEKDKG